MPRFIVESQGRVWIVRDSEDPLGKVEPRFEGNEDECRSVAKVLEEKTKQRRRRSLKFAVDVEGSEKEALMELLDALTGGSSKDPSDVARDIITRLHLGGVCQRCDQVYMGYSPERCEVCEEEMVA